MAELILKVKNSTTYKDGDILCAFSDKHIQHVHAQHICHVKTAGFNSDGLRPSTALAKFYLEKVHKYKFERVSQYEVRRTDLWTLSQDYIDGTPNAKGEYMDVPLYIARRKLHPRHRIFGTEGSEFWYGSHKRMTAGILTDIWNEIESKTSNLRADHTLWPLGTDDKKVHLGLKLDADISDAEAREYVQPEYAEKEDPPTVLQKRIKKVDWRTIPQLSLSAGNIDNPALEVDVREAFDINKAIIETKTSLALGPA